MYSGEGGYPGEGMDLGEQTTGTRDEHYNLISVLYHALHGAENCDLYALDAEAAGRADLLDFFREAQIVQTGLSERAKELLGISSAMPGAGLAPEGGAIPPETGVVETDVMAPEIPPEMPLEDDVLLDEEPMPKDVLLDEEPMPEDVPPRMEQPGTGAPPEIAVPDEDPAVTDVPPEPAMPDEAPPPGEERPLRP